MLLTLFAFEVMYIQIRLPTCPMIHSFFASFYLQEARFKTVSTTYVV
jgi:hypothetical protein